MTATLAAFAILGLALAAGFAWYERSHPTARMLALVATLAALAALGRVAFAPLPNVKPTTDIVLLAGYVLGGAPGFAVGAVGALASNLFFGQGPWTPWQMAAWGMVGVGGALLARAAPRPLGRWPLALACGLAGFAFGAVMNVSLWLTYTGERSLAALGVVFAGSFPFDAAHALGNVLFCLAFGPALVAALRRFKTRLEVTWRPLPTELAGLVVLGVLGAALWSLAAAPAARAGAPAASVRWLERAQNADGGFGGAPGQASTPMYTGWAALGLAAVGRNPADVRRGRRSALDYVRATARGGDVGEIERTLLVAGAAGASPRAFGGTDLVAALPRARRADGSFASRVNTTSFAVLALRAAGRSRRDRAVRAAAAWIARQANADGGFNFDSRGGPSGVDDTGAAIQALVAAGGRGSAVVRRATAFLVARQGRDGGFPLQPGGPSNAQSTAWAIQGLLAAGRDPARVRRGGGRSPVAYLRSLVGPSGAVRYSRASRQTPVWVTAQAITALAGKPFPLARVPRRSRAVGRAAPRPRARPASPTLPPRRDGGAPGTGTRAPVGTASARAGAAEHGVPRPATRRGGDEGAGRRLRSGVRARRALTAALAAPTQAELERRAATLGWAAGVVALALGA
jgi:energy-coupling factor transport system substrate-specific component